MRNGFSSKALKDLLTSVDVVRDPIHGDIRITPLERFIIDTPEFQRLRNINQLALTYIAYPGAVHNRFIHSIGTLHVCAEMIATCNKNAALYRNLAHKNEPVPIAIPDYCILVARLTALLHDLAHVPFGHTLEKEGRVFIKDEWQDSWRYDQIFAAESGFSKSIVEFLSKRKISPQTTRQLLEDVGLVLRTKKDEVESLPFPFIHDLVGNTLCADLIDYVKRDMYFCGLTEAFGDRFLNYLAVMPTTVKLTRSGKKLVSYRSAARVRELNPTEAEVRQQSKGNGAENRVRYRLVLLQYRYNEQHAYVQKHDVISESIDLIRKRLAVAEKLYYHRTKVAASSMLITAAHEARLKAKTIWNMSDGEVLKHLKNQHSGRARVLAEKLLKRQILKPLFVTSYHEEDASAVSNALWDQKTGAYAKFSKPRNRLLLIEKIEKIVADRLLKGDLERAKGSVTISCPSRDMSLKAFEMLVLPKPEGRIIQLQDSAHRPTRREIDAIIKAHENLWKLEVFVDPRLVDLRPRSTFTRSLAAAVQNALCVANEIPRFRNVSAETLSSLRLEGEISTALSKSGISREEMKFGDYEKLKQTVQHAKTRFTHKVKGFLIDHGYLQTDAPRRRKVRSKT